MNYKVWWIPQIPGPRFEVLVASLVEAKILLDTLAKYDLFQFKNRIKPDYSNAGGLSVFDPYDTNDDPDGSWVDWYADDGRSIDNFTLKELRELATPK